MAGSVRSRTPRTNLFGVTVPVMSGHCGQGTPAGQYTIYLYVRVGGPGGGSESPKLVMIFASPPNFTPTHCV